MGEGESGRLGLAMQALIKRGIDTRSYGRAQGAIFNIC